tara:strand:+ start:1500 stop:3608 length:2109 start_codon:yes stop_codon:yes gene_type:complete
MASKQVNIDIIAKDKTRQAMQSATTNVDKMKNAVFNLRNALIGLGAGVAIKSFVDVGKQVESLQIRLKFLFGSVDEGAKAFDVMAKFASKVPFSLQQIQQGAGNLAVVSKNAEELQEMLQITGRVASVTGLDFRTTAEQIQRSFSAGVASADIFRERGVRDLLGFKAGATVTAEETAEAFRRVFGANGRFANATSDLANTLEGRLSMIGDKFFNFQKVVAEQFFVGLKREFGALDKALEDNQKTIDDIAKSIGEGLSTAVIKAGEAVRFIKDNFEILKALGIAIVVGKIATAFLNLAVAIGKARIALLAFGTVARTSIIGAFVGISTAILLMNDAMAKGVKPTNTLNDLLRRKKLLDEQLAKSGNVVSNTLKNQVKFIDLQIQKIKDAETARAMEEAGIKRIIVETGKHTDAIILQAKALDALKNAKPKPTDGTALGIDASLPSVKPQALIDEEKLDAVKQMAKLEMDIMTQLHNDKIKSIMENDELQAELDRIRADKKIQLAHDTARKELEIQKQVMSQTMQLLKAGRAGEINVEKLTGEQKTDLAVKVGREALAEMARHNEKAFKLNKAFNLAEAIMSTARGVAKALPNIPLAIAIGALGAVQIATIAKTKYQGRRLGGRMNRGEPYMVGEAGAEMVVPDAPSTVIPNSKLNSVSQPVTVNFNINTVDARGFNELLVNSRGTIINLINSAVNEKGKMAIV